MKEFDYRLIVWMMITIGGFLIGGTFFAFVKFSRFLDREKLAGERFRAELRETKDKRDRP